MLTEDNKMHDLTDEEINKIIQSFAYSTELS